MFRYGKFQSMKTNQTKNIIFQVNDNRGESVAVSMVDNKDGTYNCSYKPLAGSKHTVQVSVSNLNSGSLLKINHG